LVVVKMRTLCPSLVGQITSSRQSPRKSADRQGLPLVPLMETQPEAVKRAPTLYLERVIPSNISRKRSPSHQAAKLMGTLMVPIWVPWAL